MKGFALGFALKQRRKATRKSPILVAHNTHLVCVSDIHAWNSKSLVEVREVAA